MTKLQATEIIKDKFWITYDENSEKSGTMTATENGFLFIPNDGSDQKILTSDYVKEHYSFEEKTTSSWYQKYVLGYPISESDVFKQQEKDGLPCYTKSEKSKIFFAAGYYCINFDNGGWIGAQSPKISTLRRYQFIGPFKTDYDMNIALKRKKNDVDGRFNDT